MSNGRSSKKRPHLKENVVERSELDCDKRNGNERNNNKSTVEISKRSTNLSASAISLRSLDDDDFRNLLNTAATPQYGSLPREKKTEKVAGCGARRLSDAEGDVGLSAEADNLLAQFRREAELSQRKADLGWSF